MTFNALWPSFLFHHPRPRGSKSTSTPLGPMSDTFNRSRLDVEFRCAARMPLPRRDRRVPRVTSSPTDFRRGGTAQFYPSLLSSLHTNYGRRRRNPSYKRRILRSALGHRQLDSAERIGGETCYVGTLRKLEGVIEVDAVVSDVWVDGRHIEGDWSGFWSL